jgi:hypothetical protein
MQKFFLLLAVWALGVPAAHAGQGIIRVKVEWAASRDVKAPPLLATDCTIWDYSGYCHGSSPVTYRWNSLLIQEPNGKRLRVGCWVLNEWSHCVELPVGESFHAIPEKSGFKIFYYNRQHKLQKQLYQIEPTENAEP